MTATVVTQSPELDDALVDARRWADEDWVHAQFAWLRENDPVRPMSPDGFDPFFSVTRHADIKAIESDKQLFINDPRPILGSRLLDHITRHLAGRRHLVRSLVTMDDPDHSRYRALTQRWFMGSNLRKLDGRITQLATEYVDRLGDLGGECDFVKDVAMWYPLRVIMTILGVPDEDEPLMLKLTQEMFGSTDPDVRRSFGAESLMDVIADFEAYFRGTERGSPRPPDGRCRKPDRQRPHRGRARSRTRNQRLLHHHRHGRPRHHEFLHGGGSAGDDRESPRVGQSCGRTPTATWDPPSTRSSAG